MSLVWRKFSHFHVSPSEHLRIADISSLSLFVISRWNRIFQRRKFSSQLERLIVLMFLIIISYFYSLGEDFSFSQASHLHSQSLRSSFASFCLDDLSSFAFVKEQKNLNNKKLEANPSECVQFKEGPHAGTHQRELLLSRQKFPTQSICSCRKKISRLRLTLPHAAPVFYHFPTPRSPKNNIFR